MLQSTRLAKIVYWLSGQVGRIKTPQAIYEMNEGPGDLADMFVRIPGRTWMSCSLTWRMIEWANRLDRKHFDHWALDHSKCNAKNMVRCDSCGEHYHEYLEDENDE